ncbi:MAG: DNA-binding response OmpR family regulator [Myxococcota bacterium]
MRSLELAGVPIIMLTADDSGETLERAFDAGTVQYLVKPVDPVELRETLLAYAH